MIARRPESGEAVSESIPGLLDAWNDACAVSPAHVRRNVLRAVAERLRSRLSAGPVAPTVRALPRVTGPLPTALLFGAALRTRAPFVRVRHRGLLVQFLEAGTLHTLLWNPTDVGHALSTPALASLHRGIGRIAASLTLETGPSVDTQLTTLGIVPDLVDRIAFDILDGQHLADTLARFPRARLLMTTAEWSRYRTPQGRDRAFLLRDPEIDPQRVDVHANARALGDGVLLLRTGGRYEGHQALVVRTADGVLVASGNAATLDGYAPALSGLPGFADSAARRGIDFVSAFPSLGDASFAMALEMWLADRMPSTPVLPYVLPSIEMVSSLIAPGVRPIALAPELSLGSVMRRVR